LATTSARIATKYESLSDWAQKTLLEHSKDDCEHFYTLEEFETGKTHDPLWNAAQMQLVREGRIHNYLRMLPLGSDPSRLRMHPLDDLQKTPPAKCG
jgi:hypothetical protein